MSITNTFCESLWWIFYGFSCIYWCALLSVGLWLFYLCLWPFSLVICLFLKLESSGGSKEKKTFFWLHQNVKQISSVFNGLLWVPQSLDVKALNCQGCVMRKPHRICMPRYWRATLFLQPRCVCVMSHKLNFTDFLIFLWDVSVQQRKWCGQWETQAALNESTESLSI